jgi:hypothetical protein
MLEFIMCIPLMAILIAAIFFFGWVMRNQQRVRIADRYTSWKHVYDTTPSTQLLNEKFFDDRGYNVYWSIDSDTVTKSVREKFIDKITDRDNEAGLYAEDIVGRNLPGGSYVLLRSQFNTNSARWRKWAESGAIERTHVRDGRSWIRGETQMPYSIRDMYLEQLNNFATNPALESSGGDMIESLYMNGW